VMFEEETRYETKHVVLDWNGSRWIKTSQTEGYITVRLIPVESRRRPCPTNKPCQTFHC